MASVFDWWKRRKIELYLYMLLAFDNDLAKAIVKLKHDWSGAALKAAKSGKKYGDVAASIILDMTDNVVRAEATKVLNTSLFRS
jgi:hypothetical protein